MNDFSYFRVPKTAHRKTCSYQLPKNIVDLFRQTFAGIELSPGTCPKAEDRSSHTNSSSHRKSRKKTRTKPPHLNGNGKRLSFIFFLFYILPQVALSSSLEVREKDSAMFKY